MERRLIKSNECIWYRFSVCVSGDYSWLTFERTTNLYETCCVRHGIWVHLNWILHKTCFCMFILHIVARQPLYKGISLSKNTSKKIIILGALFSLRSVSFQRKVDDYFFHKSFVEKDLLFWHTEMWKYIQEMRSSNLKVVLVSIWNIFLLSTKNFRNDEWMWGMAGPERP
jgi:hypothetical protein